MPNKKQERSHPGPDSLKLESLKTVLDIVGIVDGRGQLFSRVVGRKMGNSSGIPKDVIEDVLISMQDAEGRKETEDWKRQIDNARRIFTDLSKVHGLAGDRQGYAFFHKDSGSQAGAEIKHDPAYRTLLALTLSFLHMEGHASLDFLTQWMYLKHPLSHAVFLSYAMRAGLVIKFLYDNRKEKPVEVPAFLPQRIVFRDNHWLLLGWECQNARYNQFMLHSIQDMEPAKSASGECRYEKSVEDVDLEKFYRYSFGHAVLEGVPSYDVTIYVPANLRAAIQKRRSQGTWHERDNGWHWKVTAFDLDEIFTYIFRWQGNLRILSPAEVVFKFQERCQRLLEQHAEPQPPHRDGSAQS